MFTSLSNSDVTRDVTRGQSRDRRDVTRCGSRGSSSCDLAFDVVLVDELKNVRSVD